MYFFRLIIEATPYIVVASTRKRSPRRRCCAVHNAGASAADLRSNFAVKGEKSLQRTEEGKKRTVCRIPCFLVVLSFIPRSLRVWAQGIDHSAPPIIVRAISGLVDLAASVTIRSVTFFSVSKVPFQRLDRRRLCRAHVDLATEQ